MAIFIATLFFYFLVTIPFLPFLSRGNRKARFFLIHLLQNFCRFGLLFMQVKVKRHDPSQYLPQFSNGLIVCNHMSYLDVLVLYSQMPSCFVTSQEIRETPFLGQLCLLAGCLFVERRDKTNLSREVKELSQAMESGLSVTIFPEATSTDGSEVIRFRRPLFQSAIDAKKPILAMTLNYKSVSGAPVTKENRDLLCWYGDMSFLPHLWNFFKQSHVEAEILIGSLMNIKLDFDTAALAEQSHKIVSSQFKAFR